MQSRITDLYYGSRSLQQNQVAEDERWLAEYTKIVERRDELEIIRNEQGAKLKAFEAQLDNIPDTDIQGLRDPPSLRCGVMQLLLFVAVPYLTDAGCAARSACPPWRQKGPDWPGLQAMEENMQSIRTAFTLAARGDSNAGTGFSLFWMMVFAIAVIDDSDAAEKRCRRKREQAQRPPSGPRPF